MPKNRRFLRRTAALILAVLLLAAAMPSALAADTRTGTVSAPTGILLLLASPGGESAGEVPDGSAVSILSEETDANGTLWYYIQKPGGETGYVPAESVTLSEPETTPTPEETPVSEPEPTAANDRDAYLTQLRALGFPESYLEGLWQLHSRYPAWEFRPFFTNVDWNTAVNEENVLGKSLVWGSAPSSWKSTQDGAFNWTDNTWIELDSGGWVAASREIIAHYMDPRNFLDSSAVFQFLYQGYDAASQTRESLAVLVSGTFLADTTYDTDLDTSNGVNTYAETLYTAGADCGVSPYILAAMMLQEMGTNGASESISGTNRRFPGYYNAFNIGAYKTAEYSAVERGLWYASGGHNGSGTSWGRPWNSLYKAIRGGAAFYAANYVAAGQNTLYLKRFNVQGENMYWNQYMTNVAGAASEGRLLSYAYSEEMRASKLTFNIPVYLNMPEYCGARSDGRRLAEHETFLTYSEHWRAFAGVPAGYTGIYRHRSERDRAHHRNGLAAQRRGERRRDGRICAQCRREHRHAHRDGGIGRIGNIHALRPPPRAGRAGDDHRPLRFQRGRACFGRRARHGACRVYFVARRERRNAHRDGRHGRCQGDGRADVYRRFCEDHV